jgi:hypothetical protein
VVDNSNLGKMLKEKELDEQDLSNLPSIIVNEKKRSKKMTWTLLWWKIGYAKCSMKME